MSIFRQNVIANYASQIYVTLIGILLLPMYIKYMGGEAYGLIGFFAMLQAWFGILDLGLSPTIGRETARYQSGVLTALEFRQLYRALALVFTIIALIGGGGLFLSSFVIATKWLEVENLPTNDVVLAVQIMSISVALRWVSGLHRGVILGTEKLVWLSWFNAIAASLRFVGVFVSMWYFGYTPYVFFVHQFLISLIEISVLAVKTHFLLPTKQQLPQAIGWSLKPIKPILKFSLTIAFTASVWILVSQTDKLVLSGILSLEDYGYFTLAVLVANGIMAISGPISSALMPRMTSLHAEKKDNEMIRIYRESTQLVAIIAGSAAIAIVLTAEPLLMAWTGDANLAKKASPVLRLYAAGNLFLCLAAFSYYLQYARGNLRYHLIGNVGLTVLLIPSVVIAASYFGGVGAGYVWLTMNAVFLFVWVAYLHHKLEPNLHYQWMLNDVLRIIVPASFVAFSLSLLDIQWEEQGRMKNIIFVVVYSLFILATSILFRKKLK